MIDFLKWPELCFELFYDAEPRDRGTEQGQVCMKMIAIKENPWKD